MDSITLNTDNLHKKMEYQGQEIIPIEYLIIRFSYLGIQESAFRAISLDNYMSFPHIVILELQNMGFNLA